MDSAISTIIPTYNRDRLLERAISSALDQLDAEDEIIVVDDGSTDDTETVAARYGKRIRYIRTSNQGAGAARNRGVREAKNPLIAFLDSDDEWLSGKIEIQRAFMKAKPEILFCFTNFAFKEAEAVGGKEKRFNLISWSKDFRSWSEILGQGKPISSLIKLPDGIEDFNYHVGDMYFLELSANYINVNTLIVRREEAGKTLHFAEDTSTYEDWECFGRLARAGKCAYLDYETACQHSHGGTRLTDSHITECAEARIKIIERIWGNDDMFFKENHELYKRILDEQRLILADGLIVKGETKKAREQLRKMKVSPLSRRLLAALPGTISKGLLAARRIFVN